MYTIEKNREYLQDCLRFGFILRDWVHWWAILWYMLCSTGKQIYEKINNEATTYKTVEYFQAQLKFFLYQQVFHETIDLSWWVDLNKK